jgi:hypothetical protein
MIRLIATGGRKEEETRRERREDEEREGSLSEVVETQEAEQIRIQGIWIANILFVSS